MKYRSALIFGGGLLCTSGFILLIAFLESPISLVFMAVPIGTALLLFILYRKLKSGDSGEDLMQFNLDMSLKPDNLELNEANKKQLSNEKEIELPLFSFGSVSAATSNFADRNKLGQGGFGPVYKGVLANGDVVAVKRLSISSRQGLKEFKNEATIIAKVQHKNLVRLLGCCLDKDEKILIYEYMPKKSLDSFLFDPKNCSLLPWEIRVQIIEGIVQGLLYLHQFSRVRIIHRDLKAGNILLDNDMNPKISDFGMAKILFGNQLEANTEKFAGTFGYMPPEYTSEGKISTKYDVFSFGVLFLEIMTSKKSTKGYGAFDSLLLYAWDMWTSNRALDLIDPVSLEDAPSNQMLLRYVNIALLCVQENAEDRPEMSDVVSMLTNQNAPLLPPNQPAFSHVRSTAIPQAPLYQQAGTCSLNQVTISILEAR